MESNYPKTYKPLNGMGIVDKLWAIVDFLLLTSTTEMNIHSNYKFLSFRLTINNTNILKYSYD